MKEKGPNFLEQIIEEDLREGFSKEQLKFRFPPEPNGYLHIGHATSINLNFGLGEKYGAPVNLRFDDTNPTKEEKKFVESIKRDVRWLGFQWAEERYTSDYFQQLYEWALQLIKNGDAYVDSQTSEAMAQQKGTPTEAGTASPYRNRSVEENLTLFEAMKNGETPEGRDVLRAKIDMASSNMLMRDPIMYRCVHKPHHRTGQTWKIYPMYDWAHGESDFIEEVSHSFCTLEFLPHRELYNWFIEKISEPRDLKPKQREFARRNLSYSVISKRKLAKLIEEKVVESWDDPRMPTISGLRRRGYSPASIRKFADSIGVGKRENRIDISHLEFCAREDLNKTSPRILAVLDPVKIIIDNYEKDEEWLTAENNPEDESAGNREIPFSKELYIERKDFREEAGRKFFRLKLGKEVRLKSAYIIKAESVEKNENGEVKVIHCSYDPLSKSGSGTPESKRKVKGTLHWVSVKHAIETEVRLYDRLFTVEAPDADKEKSFMDFINPDSLQRVTGFVEPHIKNAEALDRFQFQRIGYFCVDEETAPGKIIFNQTVPLRDSWKKKKS